MRSPLVTVVIPTFNRYQLVLKAIESVTSQTYRPVEIIVVDDCSSDGTVEHLTSRSFPEPVQIIALSENGGPAAARNAGIENASGEYIAFLDSDDRWLPHKLERQISLLNKHPTPSAVVIYSQVYIERRHEILIRPVREIGAQSVADYVFCDGGHINSSNIILATSTARNAMYDESLRIHEDWDLYIRLEQRGVKFLMIHEPLSMTDDRPATGRASNPQLAASSKWLEHRKNSMSRRAYLASRAKLAPQLRRQDPIAALGFIIEAYWQGAINAWYLVSLVGTLVYPGFREAAYRLRGAISRVTALIS